MSSNGFTVRLERVFQGPMDLLLHLVREQEVEIHEVELARVVEGYLAHLRAMRDLDIEVAGEFLVMAATLMAIKSRSLLPGESVDLEDGLDPKDELIQRLIEYRRFRAASDELGTRFADRSQQHARGASPLAAPEPGELDLGELTAWDLLAQFSRLMRETLANKPHHVAADRRPLRWFVEEIAHELAKNGGRTLDALVHAVDPAPTRESLIGSFCALLELTRLGLVRLAQPAPQAQIEVSLCAERAAELDDVLRATIFDDEGAPAEPAPLQQSATAPPASQR